MTAIGRGARVIVTGASGFVGAHTVRLLRGEGYDVVALSSSDHDLARSWPNVGPADGIVHLAGLAAVGPSFDDPQRYISVGSSMMTNLGEALLSGQQVGVDGRLPRVLIVSSGALYGSSETPLTEDSPLDFASPYAVGKALVETQARYYLNRGLDMIVARPFNHIGPGQGSGFIVPDLAARLRAYGQGAPLVVGNIDSSRDYTDVRDVVRAYLLLLQLESPKHRIYNVASGVSRTGREVLEELCEALSMDVPPIDTEIQRELDPDHILASSRRLSEETGWAPITDFSTSIRDYVEGSAGPAPLQPAPPRGSSRKIERALVLGATGFLGSWLTHRLVESDVHVTGLSRSLLSPRTVVERLLPPTERIVADLTESASSLELGGYDLVVFAGGSASVPHSLEFPTDDLRENAGNVVALLMNLSKLRTPPVFVNVSSAAVYGNGGPRALRETMEAAPLSPYGESKLVAERYVALFAGSFGVPALSVRPFSIFGPGQNKQVVYDLSLRLLEGEEPLRILGDPSVSRDFIHVDDVARGAIHAARFGPARGEVYNLGSGRETSLGELAGHLTSLVGASGEVEFSGYVRQGDPLRWRADVSKMRRLGFEPAHDLRQGLRDTVEWVDQFRRRGGSSAGFAVPLEE